MDAARLIPPELAGAVRLGWTPEPERRLPLPAAIEEIFGGGLPRGRVCEVAGRLSSGRTSLVFTLLAAATTAGEVAAVIDAADAFDPASAARAAIDLRSLLWVRPPSARDALRCTEMILAAGGFGLVVLDLDGVPLRRLRFYTWPRLARAAEKSGAALVLLTPERIVGSFATLSVVMKRTESVLGPVLESYGILVHNKRGPVRASRRLRWSLDPAADAELGQFKIQNSRFKTRRA